jgi:hypothetical protein
MMLKLDLLVELYGACWFELPDVIISLYVVKSCEVIYFLCFCLNNSNRNGSGQKGCARPNCKKCTQVTIRSNF